MKRLHTKRENLRDLNIAFVVLWILFLIGCVCKGFTVDSLVLVLCITLPLLVISEAIVFFMWYPKERNRKRAIKTGKMYDGKIKIRMKNGKQMWDHHFRFWYSVIVSCNVDGKLITWEEEYWDNPAEYVPGSRQCKVYFYKNKYYLQYFYLQSKEGLEGGGCEYSIQDIEFMDRKELQKASMERMSKSGMNNKTTIIVPPVYFMYLKQPPMKTMFVEVRVKSENIYYNLAFSLRDRIDEYIHSVELDASTNDDVLKDGIKRLVNDVIFEKDETILVEEIFVVIR